MGNTCTRHCTFCAVNSGRPAALDPDEPQHVADAVNRLQLRHVVITTVTRDDLPDGGAAHIAETVRMVKTHCPQVTVEVLVQDFGGERAAIEKVLQAQPEVFAHNLETVRRLHPRMRDRRFSYEGSLEVLRMAAEIAPQCHIKSGFMLGCGESESEVHATLADLLDARCRVVSMGQYLQPTPKHEDVAEFITPEQFKEYEKTAYKMGFDFAVAGPFVRSSYRSEELFKALADDSSSSLQKEKETMKNEDLS